LILQLILTKFSDWKGNFIAGWDELIQLLREGFDASALHRGATDTLGVTALYWAIADPHAEITAYEADFRIVSEEGKLCRTSTDLGGPLWKSEKAVWPGYSSIPQKLWLLVTPRSAELEVNQRFSQLFSDGPPDFTMLSLQLHKVEFEWEEYRKEDETMAQNEPLLMQHVKEINDLQRTLGPKLEELGAESGMLFQQKLAAAGVEIADYRHSVGVLKQLRRTFEIDRANYMINAASLATRTGKQRVAQSPDQEGAAAQVIATMQQDQIFGPELGRMQFYRRQLDSRIDYAETKVEYLSASLRAASDQLQIAGQRNLGEMAHHLSIDSAAVVASVFAVIGTQAVGDAAFQQNAPAPKWLFSSIFVLFLATVVFAATVWLSRSRKKGNLVGYSFLVAIVLLIVLLGWWGWHELYAAVAQLASRILSGKLN
jgi:hypothetical protein